MEIANSYKHILIIASAWLILYVVALNGVRASIILSESRYWATPLWLLLYIIPGYIAGVYFSKYWVLSAVVIGIIGTAFWLLHAGLPFANIGTLTNATSNILYCLFGVWMGKRKSTA